MEQANAKKSLMNSYERLNRKAEMFDELARLSERLIDKLERTEAMPKKTNEAKEPSSDHPDLIDMFNGIDSRLEDFGNQIERNIEKAIGMIE